MRKMVTRCLMIQAILIIAAAPAQGRSNSGYQDNADIPNVYHCSDHSAGEEGRVILAESTGGVFVWNSMYCYLVPDTTCDGRDCEAVQLCCTDADRDGFYEGCSIRNTSSCPDGGDPVTAYCKK
jgi:hypothetical protein